MLSSLLSKLQDRNVRLAQLIGEKVGHFETFGDVVSNDSLKCELIFAASSRALRCVKATMTVDEAKLLDSCSIKETRAVLHKISPANGFGMTDHSDQPLQEDVVKELLAMQKMETIALLRSSGLLFMFKKHHTQPKVKTKNISII